MVVVQGTVVVKVVITVVWVVDPLTGTEELDVVRIGLEVVLEDVVPLVGATGLEEVDNEELLLVAEKLLLLLVDTLLVLLCE